MALVLLFALQLFFVFNFRYTVKSTILSILKSSLSTAVILSISTEILSFFHLIRFEIILGQWVFLNLILFYFSYKDRDLILSEIKNTFQRIKKFNLIKVILLTFFVFLFLLLIFQGFSFAPNNWDSLTYHLARVIHWHQNGSVSYYPTLIDRQLYQPPFAEYVALHAMTISRGDYSVFLIQFFSYLGSSLLIFQLCRYFVSNRKVWLSGIILSLLIPEALLQSTSTQNDLVSTFFILGSIVLFIEIYKNNKLEDFIFLGISIGIALLTKALSYIYLPIFGLFFVVLYVEKFRKGGNIKLVRNMLISLFFIVLININHTLSNYSLSNNIFGTSPKESREYALENKNVEGISSNIVKNIGIHFDPFFVGNWGDVFVEKFHKIMDYDLNKKGGNYLEMEYASKPGWMFHEDTQPNFLHVLLLLIVLPSLLLIFLRNQRISVFSMLYGLCFLLTFILFCMMLRWQPWNTRIQLTFFYLSIPIIAIVSEKFTYYHYLVRVILLILVPYSIYVAINNYSRPLVHISNTASKIHLLDDRTKKYFANNLAIYPEYNRISSMILEQKDKRIGLDVHMDSWEYVLYKDYFKNNQHFIHLHITNTSTKYAISQEVPELIISNLTNSPFITYKQRKYFNKTPKNMYLWLYK